MATGARLPQKRKLTRAKAGSKGRVAHENSNGTRGPARKLTYQDYCNAPEDERFELIDGVLLMTPASRFFHQNIIVKLLTALEEHVESGGLGTVLVAPCDVILTPNDTVQPDILFVHKDRAAIIEDRGVCGAPDLCIEVLSETSMHRDRVVKRALYHKHGVKEYWLVSPEARTIEVLNWAKAGYKRSGLFGEGDTLTSPLVAGFTPNVSRFFK